MADWANLQVAVVFCHAPPRDEGRSFSVSHPKDVPSSARHAARGGGDQMSILDELNRWRHVALAVLSLLLAMIASGHALLNKRDSRAAVGWVGLIWLVPLIGAVLYFILGVNRIRRRALELRGDRERFRTSPEVGGSESLTEAVFAKFPPETRHLASIARVVGQTTQRPLMPGNSVRALINGDEAYPAMLEAIAGAQHSITLATYIFDRDAAGRAFATALGQAVRRGVQVRVLIDATGTRYSWPPILRTLRREKIRYARFLPAFPLWRLVSMNLRNHRKLLVIDGRVGFTGGMNIRVGHWLAKGPSHPILDLQFRVEGPVVAHLQEVFADDWLFTTREVLQGELWFPRLERAGPVLARGIADGPDEDVDPLRWTILGALAAARHSVRIATPYFLPDAPVISALNLAGLRGVAVDIVLPASSNLPFVQWASRALWWQVLEKGCRIWLTPGNFDHSKLFLVDDGWVMLGSTNWDPRSLRLNFEFDVECYDTALVQTLGHWFQAKKDRSRQVTLAEVDARSLPVKLRDGAARLLSPYL
ncbi:MAG TPA: phospholipase D-like domain-containing protein [Verrucomicrobiae bacterium]|nr:phospholipase D-like domain-containing protein [Verrucomicrobiae bacterium]